MAKSTFVGTGRRHGFDNLLANHHWISYLQLLNVPRGTHFSCVYDQQQGIQTAIDAAGVARPDW